MSRIRSFDALRGIASVTVVLAHFHGVLFRHHIVWDLTPARVLWAGGEAVILFFILSGFVLSAPFFGGEQFHFKAFLGSRLLRIYAPYALAIAVCVMLSRGINWLIPFSSMQLGANPWPGAIDWSLLASHAGLLGNFDTAAYDNVIWSLVHEMRFAIIFPIYLWVLKRLPSKACLHLGGGFSFFAALAIAFGADASLGFKNSFLYTLHYLLFFVLGGLLAKNTSAVRAAVHSLTKAQTNLILIVGVILYSYSTIIFHALPVAMKLTQFAQIGDFIADWGVGAASVVILSLAAHRNSLAFFLQKRAFLFLGKVSYSLYLIHLPVLMATMFFCAKLPQIMALLIAAAAIGISTIAFYRLVELPAHRIARKIFKSQMVSKITPQPTGNPTAVDRKSAPI